MAKVNPQEHSKRRPKLTIDDFEGADASALTIASVEIINVDDEDGKRKSMVISFEETGDKVYWPNPSSISVLVAQYGDESDDWVGKPLPLVRHEGVFRGKRFDNLQVPTPELWREVIEGAGLTPVKTVGKMKANVKAAKRAAKGRGR